jgi:hypothetical protein
LGAHLPVVALPLDPPLAKSEPLGEPMRTCTEVTPPLAVQPSVVMPRLVPSQTGIGFGGNQPLIAVTLPVIGD